MEENLNAQTVKFKLVRCRINLDLARRLYSSVKEPSAEGYVYDSVCFYCQLACEEAAKAVFFALNPTVTTMVTHDISFILKQGCKLGKEENETSYQLYTAASKMATYSVRGRYGDIHYLDGVCFGKDKADEALGFAELFHKWAEQMLLQIEEI